MIKTDQYNVLQPSQPGAGNAPGDPKENVSAGDHGARLKEAFTKAKSIVDAANSYSDRHIREAVERMNTESAQVRQRSRQEGFAQGAEEGRKEGEEQGYQQGYQDGLKRAAGQNQETLEQFQSIIRELETKRERIVQEFEDGLTELSIQIAKAILHREIDRNDDTLPLLVESVLEQYQGQEWAKVYVSETMLSRLRANPELLEGFQMTSQGVKWMPAHKLTDTDCVIELPTGVVDASFDTQMEKIKSIIKW